MSAETEGKVDFKVGSETYQTWYKTYGDIKNSKHRPVVVVHGGPGMSHHYLLPHKAIYEKLGIPVLFYDQIGNGASSHCPDVPKEFWTPELFMDELDNLLNTLGISYDFDLLGQSWGGMLGAQYAGTRLPKGLKRLIISNSPASVPLMVKGTEMLLSKFSPDFVETVRKHEAAGTYNDKEYQDATQVFYRKHICTTDPWPEELNATFACAIANPTIYHAMLGPSEFSIIGSLKDWSIVDILHKIAYPTLLISSTEDEVQELSVRPFFLKIPKIKWVEFQNSSHLPAFEEPERYFQVLFNFLTEVEA
ncbi:Alpha/Beta hydrolase protein [Gymnopilus junonius]|uniref:Alpha/Beta hydrolase protein n=1 Tax=Gymnopilus junonius TaxID=109634 RepID=A0A9P5NSV4_GYMJU|nr:Alpha/Beta hydrolase protein [Gymnopilus junonius]